MSSSPFAVTELTADEVQSRIARFSKLIPMESQSSKEFPQDVADIVWARRLMPVIGVGGDVRTVFGRTAPIEGAAGMTMVIAACPPGTGPCLHVHRDTFETFTVLTGTFEFLLAEDGRHKVTLEPFDTLSVPPRVYRCFTNVSNEEAFLQVVISGGVEDMEDVGFTSSISDEIAGIDPQYVKKFEDLGYRFDFPSTLTAAE